MSEPRRWHVGDVVNGSVVVVVDHHALTLMTSDGATFPWPNADEWRKFSAKNKKAAS